MRNLQIIKLFKEIDDLHAKHGCADLQSIYGAGEINNPNICLIFMNPTSKNVSAGLTWEGLRAPWLGTKNVWRMLFNLELLDDKDILNKILTLKPEEWNDKFSNEVYELVASKSIYITNLAKCTQEDARPLSDSIFREFRDIMIEELVALNPKIVVTFGNQVSSILLNKPVSVSKYLGNEFEELKVSENKSLKIYPCYYPVGQGQRNIHIASKRITTILNNHNG